MIIWLLALVLFVCLGYVGFALGAIRLAAWLLGVIVGAYLAFPLGHVFNSLLSAMGVKDPVTVYFVGPLLVFLVVLVIFKVIGQLVHQKVDVYYKYKAGDLRMGLWNRLNSRVGISMGAATAAAYLIVISWVIYAFSYWTVQTVTTDSAPWTLRTLNSAGRGVQSSGMSKVAAAIDPLPQNYYKAADLAGLIYNNDLLEGRLSRYPAFFAMGERAEFQDIANDKSFTELRQRQPPIAEIIDNPKAQKILNNPDLLREVWALVTSNMDDLTEFLKTGKSAKYDNEKILGRWDFNLSGSLNVLKRTKQNIGFLEMQRTKQAITLSFAKTTLVAGPEPDRMALLKDFGKLRPAAAGKPSVLPTVDTQSFKGQWTADGTKYQLSFPDKGGSLEAVVEGDRLTITGDTYPMVFDRE